MGRDTIYTITLQMSLFWGACPGLGRDTEIAWSSFVFPKLHKHSSSYTGEGQEKQMCLKSTGRGRGKLDMVPRSVVLGGGKEHVLGGTWKKFWKEVPRALWYTCVWGH